MITVHSAECPKRADGRTQHLYRKVDGEFVCSNCGQVSDPDQRWESADKSSRRPGGEETLRAAANQDCQVLGDDHASLVLPEEESARPASTDQQLPTCVANDRRA